VRTSSDARLGPFWLANAGACIGTVARCGRDADRIDTTGVVTLRHAGPLHIGIGRTHVILLVQDRDIA
jgi:hypothetical protein